MMTSLECSTSARNRCSLARSRSAARLRSVMSRPTSTTWSRLMGEIAPENQTSRPGVMGVAPLAPPRGSGGGSPRGRRLVQHEPIEPQLPHRLHELSEVDGFPDVAVRPQPVARDQVPLLARGGEDDDWQQAGAL